MANEAVHPPNTGFTGQNVPSKGSFPLNEGHSSFDNRIQMWTARRQRSQELKQLHEHSWVINWDHYRNVVDPLTDPADWWRSNEPVPTVFKVVETILPRLVTGMFDSPDWFYVEARNGRSEVYETLCYNLLKQALEDMELFPKIVQALRYSLIMGHCWGKVIWREEHQPRQVLQEVQLTNREVLEQQFGQAGVDEAADMYGPDVLDQPSGVMGMEQQVVNEEVFNGPDFEWRPLDRVFPDPSGRGRWYLEEIHTTIDELWDTQDDIGAYDENVLKALEGEINLRKAQGQYGGLDHIGDARSGTTAGVSIEYAREPETTEGIPEWVVTPMRDGAGVSIWQCWGWVPPDQRGPENIPWRLVVIAEGKYILRDIPAPTPDGRPPYFPIKYIDIPTRLYGESIISYIGPLAEQQTRLANMRLDEVFLGVWQQYLFRKNAVVSDNALLMQPGGAIEVNPEPGQSIADTFQILPRKPVMPDVWQEDNWRQMQAEEAAAATDVMQGAGAGSRATATEVQSRLQQGNARHVLQIMMNDYTVKKELLERVWKWLQMRMTSSKLVRMQGEEYAEVDLRDIQIPVDIGVAGGLFALSRQNKVQMDQELIQFLTNPETLQYFKPLPIFKKWMQDRGWKNPDNYLKTQEEFNEELRQDGFNQGMASIGDAEMQAELKAAAQSGGMAGLPSGATGGSPERMPEVPTDGDAASLGGEPLA